MVFPKEFMNLFSSLSGSASIGGLRPQVRVACFSFFHVNSHTSSMSWARLNFLSVHMAALTANLLFMIGVTWVWTACISFSSLSWSVGFSSSIW